MKVSKEQLASVVIHPFLFAALPIVASLLSVKELALPEEMIPILVIVEIFTLIYFGIASLILRNFYRAGVLTTLTIGLFFSYRMIAYAIDSLTQSIIGKHLDDWIVLCIFAFLSLICLSASLKTKWDFGKSAFDVNHQALSKSLNMAGILLLIINAAPLAEFEMKDESANQKFVKQFSTAFDNVQLDQNASNKPDVYYFIVDGFANPRTMKELFNCDDDRLFRFMKKQGFYVVPKAASNYDRTEYSLSSSFNMQYINSIPDELGKDYAGLNLFCRMIQDSAVRRTFKRLGYKFVNVSSGNSATDWIYDADKNFRCAPFNHFMTAVALLTPLYATEKYFPLMRDLLADMRLCPGNCLAEVVAFPGPKFVLIHTEIAHAPCLFDEHGGRHSLPEGSFMINWGTPVQAAGQWKFAQGVLIDWLTKLLDDTKRKSVIIVQSDHGSGIDMPNHNDWNNERMRILNAYYFPDVPANLDKKSAENKGLYETITPVNSFRVLFNDYFSAKLPLLPDKTYSPEQYARPFYWVDVKDKLKFD